ncbi:hypothetical protein GQ457_01G024910 [Hibiscus cannabinus]
MQLSSNRIGSPFRFEASWLLEHDCAEVIRNFWCSTTADLPQKLELLGKMLHSWGSSVKKQKRKFKIDLEQRLRELENADPDDEILAELVDVKLGLNLEADKEENNWEQRARTNWLLKGDKNTVFFIILQNRESKIILLQRLSIMMAKSFLLWTVFCQRLQIIFQICSHHRHWVIIRLFLIMFVEVLQMILTGGKETFIKAVLQAIPVYAMQCFLLPKVICTKLESIMNAFWWKNNNSSRGIHWCTWSKLCLPKAQGGLGFRDLSKFNIALLAKQGWRILTNPTSLLARVLKARYFPRTDFLHASLGASPSYTWRSIFSARGLLEQGIGWRVGTGQSISVWNDAWLPGHGNGRLNLHVNFRFPKVSDLIVPETNCWNIDLLQSLFPQSLVNRICCIPLAKSKPEDVLIWRCDNSGIYSPKSGYKLLMQENNHISVSGTVVQDSILHSFYSKLWGLNIPTKCKIFFWRLLNNFLPTFVNLKFKRVQVRNTCPLCDFAAESTDHFLFLCPFIKQVLSSVGLPHPPANHNSFYKDVFAGWFVNSTAKQQMLLVITYWAIWHARNKFIYEDSSTIKLNFDAAFNYSNNTSVSGIVARNSQGLVMAACTFPHSAVADAFSAEAIACELAVNFASDLGFRSVQVEGDSLSIIKKLNATTMDRSLISPIISDIQSLRGSFDNITFSFVGRQGNMVAHELVKLGILLTEPMYWMKEVPMQVERLVFRDLPP